MKTKSLGINFKTFWILALFICFGAFNLSANQTLWSIGKVDKSFAEFSTDSEANRKTAQYVIGRSMPHQDWSNMQMGPADAWAGSKVHSNCILFSLKEKPAADQDCKLELYFQNVHKEIPPKLEFYLNNQLAASIQLPPGQGDALMYGQIKEALGTHVTVVINSSYLNKGLNLLEIRDVQGSWVFYDAIEFVTPETDFDLALEGADNQQFQIMGADTCGVILKGENATNILPINLQTGYVGKPMHAAIYVDNQAIKELDFVAGGISVPLELPVKNIAKPFIATFSVKDGENTLAEQVIKINPPKLRELHLFPHSHVDIGYTHTQADVVKVQNDNMNIALELIDNTRDFPPEAQFKWNPESLWVLDNYLQTESEENKARLMAAISSGSVSFDALFGNMLTALCRPEELYYAIGYFSNWAQTITHKEITSAAICDVPGYTWGTPEIMGKCGIKYFAIAPNYSDRIGTIHSAWNDKPFYWQSQSGEEKVLCWVTAHYWKHGDLEKEILAHLKIRQQSDYPYDTEWMYWIGLHLNGACDNSPPDRNLPQAVMDWNAKYASPKLVIDTAGRFFKEFEAANGSKLPTYSGDITPYWEDGAGSTSAETALNRRSADKLSQAETLWAITGNSQPYPAEEFREAWKNVLLYSEHTWGAWCSISQPEDPFTVSQWQRKQQFALDAAKQSQALLDKVLASREGSQQITVWNTTGWQRSQIVKLPKSEGITAVEDDQGNLLPVQTLTTGETVFLATDVPALGARVYTLSDKQPGRVPSPVGIRGGALVSSTLSIGLDRTNGAIKFLHFRNFGHNFVDNSAGQGLNQYYYLQGVDTNKVQTNPAVTIMPGETGPLVASLIVTSDAPGCNRLVREIVVTSGSDNVQIIDHVDRQLIREKDAVHFGFPFNVPEGKIHMEVPWAIVRPNEDQLPGSCYNWYTVQRYVDISNQGMGITWMPIDAPLMQIGGITANLLGSVGLKEWATAAADSQTIYSWAQNNHWHTNYKAEQPGETTFVYVITPHTGAYNPVQTARLGLETTRPLLLQTGAATAVKVPTVDNPNLILETLKHATAGGLAYRIQNPTDKEQVLALGKWKKSYNVIIADSEPRKAPNKVKMPPHGVLFLEVR